MRNVDQLKKRATLLSTAAGAAVVLLYGAPAAKAQVSLTTGTYTQDFNTLANTGTSSTLPTGWQLLETGSNANTTYAAGTGSDTGGNTYSFGGSGSTERALGTLLSSSLTSTIGASFTNNTGGTISSFTITFDGEQWRRGGGSVTADRLDFQYNLGATALNTPTTGWVDVNALDINSKITTNAAATLDGNDSANKTTGITATISGLSITAGSTFFIRWVEFNVTGSDDGLAVDNFNLSFVTDAVPTGPTQLYFDTTGATAGTGGSGNWDTTTSNWSTTSAGDVATSAYTSTVPITFGGTGGDVTVAAGGVAFSGGQLTISANGYSFSGGSISLDAPTNLVVTGGNTATIASALVGSGALNKQGSGTLVLSGTSSNSGGTNILDGTLQLAVDNALLSTGAVSVGAETATLAIGTTNQTFGAFSMSGGSVTGTGVITASSYLVSAGTIDASLAGATGFTKSGSGIANLGGTNTYTGATTVSGGTLNFTNAAALPTGNALAVSGAGSVVNLGSGSYTTGNVTLSSGQLVGSGANLTPASFSGNAGTISGVTLQGSTGLTKFGNGTLVLDGSHSYAGNTTVATTGTLVVNGTISNSAVTVDGTLRTGAAATFGSTVTLNTGGTLTPGGIGSVGTINSGAMTFNTGTFLNFDLGPSSDLINLGSNALTVNGTSTINYAGASIVAGQAYTLFTAGSFNGTNFTTGTKPGGLGSATYNWTGSEYTVTFTAVPKGLGPNPYSYTTHGTRVSEDFNFLASSGTGSITAVPQGWQISETGSSADGNYNTSTGSSGTGDVYSFGAANDGNRSLGQVRSGNVITVIGFNLKNDTGSAMTEVNLQYTGQQWRLGQAGRVDKLIFQYSTIASTLTEGVDGDGTWVSVPELEFIAPITTGSARALDGLDPANSEVLSALISGLNVAAGDGIWFRWVDFDATGTDDGLAIDNVTFVPEPASLSLLALGGMGLLKRRRRAKALD